MTAAPVTEQKRVCVSLSGSFFMSKQGGTTGFLILQACPCVFTQGQAFLYPAPL